MSEFAEADRQRWHGMEKKGLKLKEFCRNHHPSKVKMLIKVIRRGIREFLSLKNAPLEQIWRDQLLAGACF